VEFLQRHALAVDRRPEAVAYRLTANVGFRCTSTLSRGPAALGNQARDGMVAYQKAGSVRTYTVEPKAFEAPQ